MSIKIRTLGRPGDDNAVLMTVDSGNAIHRLLFDCGARCLNRVPLSDIQAIDHLFFSHYHMDHVCGFDTFFRHNYNRPRRPVHVWGPPGTIDIIHHRMQGYVWNLHHRQPGKWIVTEMTKSGALRTAHFLTREAFQRGHIQPEREIGNEPLVVDDDYKVTARALYHGSIPSMAYRVDEPDRENIDPKALKSLGFAPGPWVRTVKENEKGEVEIEGKTHSIAELRAKLTRIKRGASAAYLTDYHLEPGSKLWKETAQWLGGIGTIVSEAQYLEADYKLAKENDHMTAERVARLAGDAGAERLIIQHLSRRYDRGEWKKMLEEASAVFPQTRFPSGWRV